MSIDGAFSLARDQFVLNVTFAIDGAVTTALCGRSGAGKSTLLRCIAGLEPDVKGRLNVLGESWLSDRVRMPAHERQVGFVTQEPHLFSHLNVFDNLRYGARRTSVKVNEEEVIESLGLRALLTRQVSGLSGGEKQRVAIARALLRAPRVLLLDEPVSALDVASRHEVLTYLQRVLRTVKLPCLYVSHDLREAARVADQMMWVEHGRIVAHGPSAHVLTDLRLPFAELDEAESVLRVVVSSHQEDEHLTLAHCGDDSFWLPRLDLEPGATAMLQILARDVSLALAHPSDISIQNILHARIDDVQLSQQHPGQMLVRLQVGEQRLLARVTQRSAERLQLRVGLELWALVKAVALVQ